MSIRIQSTAWHEFVVQVFQCAGVSTEHARLAAAVRVESALRQPAGIDAFGVMRLHNTMRRLQAGGINPTPRIRVVREQSHVVLLDGDNGLGAVVGTVAMQRCVQQGQGQGLALVGVRNSTTLGTMAFYAMRALEHGLIGFVTTNTELKIGLPPWGGVTPALGNNPFAIAIPAGQKPTAGECLYKHGETHAIADRQQNPSVPPAARVPAAVSRNHCLET